MEKLFFGYRSCSLIDGLSHSVEVWARAGVHFGMQRGAPGNAPQVTRMFHVATRARGLAKPLRVARLFPPATDGVLPRLLLLQVLCLSDLTASPSLPRATFPPWARPGRRGPTSTRTRAVSTTACSSSGYVLRDRRREGILANQKLLECETTQHACNNRTNIPSCTRLYVSCAHARTLSRARALSLSHSLPTTTYGITSAAGRPRV